VNPLALLRIAAQQPFYLPDFYYFYKIVCSDIFFVADFLRFRKQSPMVRADFIDFNLTVPVQHHALGPHPSLAKLTMVPKEMWRHKHLGTLKSKYGSFPFFEYYYPELIPIYQRNSESLVEFLWDILYWHLRLLFPHKKVQLCSREEIYSLENLKSWLKKSSDYAWLIHSHEKSYYKEHFPGSILKELHLKKNLVFPELYKPSMPLLVLLFLKGPETMNYFQGKSK
jgi:hypothetical protein